MKTFEKILTIITILFLTWLIISYIQITSQNLDFDTPTQLSNWNLFQIFENILQPPFLKKFCPCANHQVYGSLIYHLPMVIKEMLLDGGHKGKIFGLDVTRLIFEKIFSQNSS